jgi:CRISPR-associated endonuclease Cas1
MGAHPAKETVDAAKDPTWADRGKYWESIADVCLHSYANRRQDNPPLELIGHGVRLRVDKGTLLITEGLTHYPQDRKEHRFFPGDRRLPSRIVLGACDGYLSLSVLEWLARHEIELLALDWRGEIVSISGLNIQPFHRKILNAQRSTNPDRALQLGRWLITRKLRESLVTLNDIPDSMRRAFARAKIESEICALQATTSLDDVRLCEARGALAYWRAWRSLQIRWKGIGTHPIPLDWLVIAMRQSLYGSSNRNATHPVNAMLNLAYGVLEADVRSAASAAGLDLTIGILHSSNSSRSALVYDLMEPHRAIVDRIILSALRSHMFARKDFVITKNGTCRLHPQLSRVIISQRLNRDLVCATISEFLTRLN